MGRQPGGKRVLVDITTEDIAGREIASSAGVPVAESGHGL